MALHKLPFGNGQFLITGDEGIKEFNKAVREEAKRQLKKFEDEQQSRRKDDDH